MSWLRELQSFEWLLIVLLGLFYILFAVRYVLRTHKIGGSLLALIPKFIIRTAAVVLIFLALRGPSFGSSKEEVKSIGKDIMIALDLSQSMNARDIQPSRLEKTKFELKNLVEAFSSDRIGILIFSNEAFVQCPLTYDQSALNLFIETLQTSLVPSSGTDFGPALKMAREKLMSQENEGPNPSSKIILLISDGEDFGDETEKEAREIEKSNIRLFTLGVGSEEGATIPIGRGVNKTDRSGNEVITTLESRSLKKLAADTGGKYFEINKRVNDTERLINAINNIEGELRESRMMNVAVNKYVYFLAGAIVLLLIDVMLPIKTLSI